MNVDPPPTCDQVYGGAAVRRRDRADVEPELDEAGKETAFHSAQQAIRSIHVPDHGPGLPLNAGSEHGVFCNESPELPAPNSSRRGGRRAHPRAPAPETKPGQWQSTATESASQTARMRSSPRRPSRLTRTPTDTLSTESRLTAHSRGTGSTPGSSTTSLGSPLMVVVHGAITARPSRGIATSRLNTTTGLLPISGSSHHQSSPRRGWSVTTRQRLNGTTQDRPTHRPRRPDARRTRRTNCRSRPADGVPRARRVPGRRARSRRVRPSPHEPL